MTLRVNMFKRIVNFLNAYQETPSIEYSHEQKLIDKIIHLLETKPEKFSARWFDGKSLDESVRSLDGEVIIMIKTGEIVSPVKLNTNSEQKEKIKNLLKPIVKKDSDYIIERLLNKM